MGFLNAQDQTDEPQCFYLNIRLDGYSDPSLFSVAQQLRHWFYENPSLGIPFRSADEVKRRAVSGALSRNYSVLSVLLPNLGYPNCRKL